MTHVAEKSITTKMETRFCIGDLSQDTLLYIQGFILSSRAI
jgi:hypothetical protein